ncbi:MAG: hypothetical protein GXY86_15580 [Firmicutes bacterium]|nr:hypothetical protein [Bacillota bacterium]
MRINTKVTFFFICILLISSTIVVYSGKINETKQSKENFNVIIFEDQVKSNEGLKLGLSIGKVKDYLKQADVRIVNEVEIGTIGYKIICKGMEFVFNSSKRLTKVYVFETDNLCNSKGIKVDDGYEKMISLYGEKYDRSEEMEAFVYEYKYTKNYFFIAISYKTNKIIGWGIQTLHKGEVGDGS